MGRSGIPVPSHLHTGSKLDICDGRSSGAINAPPCVKAAHNGVVQALKLRSRLVAPIIGGHQKADSNTAWGYLIFCGGFREVRRLETMYLKGVVHILDYGGSLAEKAPLFEAIGLEPNVHRSPLQFLKGFAHAKPCCLVSAMRLPELPGLELLALLQRQSVPPPVIMITAYGDIKSAVQAMKLGAAEFLESPVDDELLLRLAQNWIRVDRARHAKANKCAAVREKLSKLSAREREVLSGLLDSLSNKEIAARLNISPKSVEVYRSKLMTKMEVCSIPALVREVLCCPVFQCSPLDFGYLCTGAGCVNNALGQDTAFDASKEIHFSRIEYAASKHAVNASRGAPNCDR